MSGSTDDLARQDVPARLADVLGDLARTLQDKTDVTTTLGAIVDAAIRNIPGTEECGITLIEKGVLSTMAPGSEVVERIDQVQYELGEGPCVDAIVDHEVYRTGDLLNEGVAGPGSVPRPTSSGSRRCCPTGCSP